LASAKQTAGLHSSEEEMSNFGLGGVATFGGRARIEVSGAQELSDALHALGKRGIEIGKEVLDETTPIIATKAKALCPVDDIDGGELRDSIRTTKARSTAAGRISAGIVAGGAKVEQAASEKGHKEPGLYALVVHEDASLRHPNGGQYKFIEQPALEEAPNVPKRIESKLARVTGG
jgi:hypothetical protein